MFHSKSLGKERLSMKLKTLVTVIKAGNQILKILPKTEDKPRKILREQAEKRMLEKYKSK